MEVDIIQNANSQIDFWLKLTNQKLWQSIVIYNKIPIPDTNIFYTYDIIFDKICYN